MIALASDCLIFRMSSGESIPFSAEMVSVELMGEAASKFDPEFVKNAAASVFHHFKYDLGREHISVGEFACALENILRGFGCTVYSSEEYSRAENSQRDLRILACESGSAGELIFFPMLRDALRVQLRRSPTSVRFHGLRGCVKHLAGAQRWSPRCDVLREQILEYLRQCLLTETPETACSLRVD